MFEACVRILFNCVFCARDQNANQMHSVIWPLVSPTEIVPCVQISLYIYLLNKPSPKNKHTRRRLSFFFTALPPNGKQSSGLLCQCPKESHRKPSFWYQPIRISDFNQAGKVPIPKVICDKGLLICRQAYREYHSSLDSPCKHKCLVFLRGRWGEHPRGKGAESERSGPPPPNL